MLPSILISLRNCKWCLTAQPDTRDIDKGHRSTTNDQPLSSPHLTNNLLGVVLRILQEPVPLSSGIEAIFHQVMVDPNDVDTLWFLWWPDDDLSKEPVEYTFLVARLHQVGKFWSSKDGSMN